ncbi:MAG: DUF72 domain-containing protein [Ardenticatenia bacterium]|nr:DUF72 domain-containing protein [Ardenticatenia bacterium]
MTIVYVGTSGYSFRDWVGPYYPADLDRRAWLQFYAQEFNAVELNVTFYRQPTRHMLARMADKVPEGFRFTLKLYRGLTHERDVRQLPALARQFADALVPLIEAAKFGCVLAQFPFSFRHTPEAEAYVRTLRAALPEIPMAVEFRRREWAKRSVFDLLRDLDLAFCAVDMPPLPGLMPPVVPVTADFSYVRFHGRNRQTWWKHREAWERYDYRYTEKELLEWGPRLRAMRARAATIYLFANNHWQGQAVETARALKRLLVDSGEG